MNDGSAFDKVFIGIHQTLKASPTFTDLVPKENIRPYMDPTKPIAGGVCVYAWDGSEWNRWTKRGEGNLLVLCEHPEDGLKAAAILALFRTLIDEESISGYGADVHRMRESSSFNDSLPPKLNQYSVTSSFHLHITEGDVEKGVS